MMTTSANAPLFPFKRPSNAIPPVEFAELRVNNPACKVKLWDESQVWLVTRHKDVCEVLQDKRFSKVRTHPNFPELGPGGKSAAKAGKPTFVDMDPPEHTKQRSMVQSVFTKHHVKTLRSLIQKTVDDCVVKLSTQSQPANLISSFALPVPYLVIARMLGIPDADAENLITWNAVRTSGSSTAREAAEASQGLTEYLRELVKKKEENPGDDLISKLILEQLRPGYLEMEDVVQITFLLLVAGNATVASMIGLGVVTLFENPGALEELKSNPSVVNSFVEELLRYHTASAMATRRVAMEDVIIGGKTIRANEGVIASNQSANRDETVFPDSDRFNIHREPNPHIAFGYGVHECVAKWLARAELQCVFGTLFKTLPGLKIVIPLQEVKYTDPSRDVGVVELPVVW